LYLWHCTSSQSDNDQIENKLNNASEWNKILLRKFEQPICKISWEVNEDYLAVSTTDGIITLLREVEEGKWDVVKESNQEGLIEDSQN
jgi:hypothetical protein